MSITKTQAESFVTENLGGDPESLTVAQIINTAGVSMVNMRAWKYLQETEVDLDLTADQAYVNLPANLISINSIVSATRGEFISWVSRSQMLGYRKGDMGSPVGYAVSFVAAAVSGVPQHRLDLYPTPSETVADAITVSYKAGWTAIDALGDSSPIPIPQFLEPLFLEVLLAVAKGFEKNDMGNLSPRIHEVRAGTVFADAVRTDAALQPILSSIPMTGTRLHAAPITLADPEVV